MSDEKSGFDGDQTGKTVGNWSLSPVVPYKPGKPIALGFVLGAVYIFYALASGSIADISLIQLLMELAALIGFCTIACICFKRWMRDEWSNKHWFVKTSLFLGNVFYGIALFVMVFGTFGFIFWRK